MYWPLGLVVAVAAGPDRVALDALREGLRRAVSRGVQDEQGDLATLRRGGRRRHPRDQVLRPQPSTSPSSTTSRRTQLRDTSIDKVRLSAQVLDLPRDDPQPRRRGRAAARRDRRRPRRPDARRAGRLHHPDAVAGVAGGLARRDPGDGPGGDDRRRARPRDLRHRARHRRRHGHALPPSRAATCASSTSTSPSPTSSDTPGAARRQPRHPARARRSRWSAPPAPARPSLTALVPRLYDVTGGRITIDGVDVRDFTLGELRSLVATAFEEPTLFSMSARENLTLGRADATEAEIERGARRSPRPASSTTCPWGLDTRIGEQGMSLSGGQRQRLALARAVLAQPQRAGARRHPLRARHPHREAGRGGAAPGARRHHRPRSWPTAPRPCCSPTGSPCSRTARSPTSATTASCSATVPAYRELLAADCRRRASRRPSA